MLSLVTVASHPMDEWSRCRKIGLRHWFSWLLYDYFPIHEKLWLYSYGGSWDGNEMIHKKPQPGIFDNAFHHVVFETLIA